MSPGSYQRGGRGLPTAAAHSHSPSARRSPRDTLRRHTTPGRRLVMNAVPAEISALVTGASSGIGEQFARRLAARGHDLILVARRGQRMRRLAAELEESHRVSVSVLVADLSTATGRDAVVGPLRSRSPWLLINNAGFGTMGRFVEIDPKRANEMVAVNALAVHELTLAVLPGNVSAGGGGILNVASTAALQPLPYFATYAATKAFVLHLSE